MKAITWNDAKVEFEGTKVVYAKYQNRFVARFKYYRPKTAAKAFVKFLTENFTPEEYFAYRKEGLTPVDILKKKGYVSPNEKLAKPTNV